MCKLKSAISDKYFIIYVDLLFAYLVIVKCKVIHKVELPKSYILLLVCRSTREQLKEELHWQLIFIVTAGAGAEIAVEGWDMRPKCQLYALFAYLGHT